MIVGVGHMPPREFFNIARVKNIHFDWNKTAIVCKLDNLSRFHETHNHIIYFDIPETLIRVEPLHLFDFRFQGFDDKNVPMFSEKRPIWALIRYCVHAPKFQVPTPRIGAKTEVLQAIVSANRRNDVLDKLNLITSILEKQPLRKKAEKAIVDYLMGFTNLAKTVARLESLKPKDKSYLFAVQSFREWTSLPIKDHLIRALSELLKNPDSWRDNISHVSIAYGIRHFELGYIMSFLERQKA